VPLEALQEELRHRCIAVVRIEYINVLGPPSPAPSYIRLAARSRDNSRLVLLGLVALSERAKQRSQRLNGPRLADKVQAVSRLYCGTHMKILLTI
jgi:hypothetical protein